MHRAWPLILLGALSSCGSEAETSATPASQSAGAAGAAGASAGAAGAGAAGASAGAAGASAGAAGSGAGAAGAAGASAGAAGAGAGAAGAAGASAGAAGSSAGAAGSSAGAAGASGGAACAACQDVAASANAIALPYAALLELSGLAASRVHAGVLYGHNDSGDTARFFAFTTSGDAKGEFVVTGEKATDWEDVAAGPCGSESCLFFADVGDNDEKRTEVSLVKVVEPPLPADATAKTPVSGERVRFVYPDGPHNAETLLVHPKTGDAYVVTKVASGASAVYALTAPLVGGPVRTATKVADLPLPSGGSLLATGGDVHPCGDRFLLRTYNRLYEYRAVPGMPFETAFAAAPVTLPSPTDEPQAEAVAYLATGLGLVTGSEDPLQKAPPPLHVRGCK